MKEGPSSSPRKQQPCAHTPPSQLGRVAKLLYRERRARDRLLAALLISEGAWDLLLDLYAAKVEGKRVSIMTACEAACIPTTTAQRVISRLVEQGVVTREADCHDRRVFYLGLSPSTEELMSMFFQTVAACRSEWNL